MASIIAVKQREREKRSSVEELLALPDSSLVSVISFDCQLAFRNVNGEKQSIHSNSITFLQSQMYQRINSAQKTTCPGKFGIKKFIFFPIARISDRCSLLDLEPNTWRLLRRFQCASVPFAFPFVFQVPAAWVVLPSSNDDAFGILQRT